MRSSYDLPSGRVNLSRRPVMLSGAVMMANGLVTPALSHIAFAEPSINFIPLNAALTASGRASTG